MRWKMLTAAIQLHLLLQLWRWPFTFLVVFIFLMTYSFLLHDAFGPSWFQTQGRESIAAKLVANLITQAGADRVLSCDLHSGQAIGYFDIFVDHVSGQVFFLHMYLLIMHVFLVLSRFAEKQYSLLRCLAYENRRILLSCQMCNQLFNLCSLWFWITWLVRKFLQGTW